MRLLSRLHLSVHIYVMIVDLVFWWGTPKSDTRGVPDSLALPNLDVIFYALCILSCHILFMSLWGLLFYGVMGCKGVKVGMSGGGGIVRSRMRWGCGHHVFYERRRNISCCKKIKQPRLLMQKEFIRVLKFLTAMVGNMTVGRQA